MSAGPGEEPATSRTPRLTPALVAVAAVAALAVIAAGTAGGWWLEPRIWFADAQPVPGLASPPAISPPTRPPPVSEASAAPAVDRGHPGRAGGSGRAGRAGLPGPLALATSTPPGGADRGEARDHSGRGDGRRTRPARPGERRGCRRAHPRRDRRGAPRSRPALLARAGGSGAGLGRPAASLRQPHRVHRRRAALHPRPTGRRWTPCCGSTTGHGSPTTRSPTTTSGPPVPRSSSWPRPGVDSTPPCGTRRGPSRDAGGRWVSPRRDCSVGACCCGSWASTSPTPSLSARSWWR